MSAKRKLDLQSFPLPHEAARPVPPRIGAQVFIEPGQTPKDIDDWFRILEEGGMKVCRIRMFETHMHRADGSWDFSLYDEAFRAAERHGVNVFATLFPADDTVGGFKHPRNKAHLVEIAEYVSQIVNHFKDYPALYCWVLQNEPGLGCSYPPSDLADRLKKEWKASLPASAYDSKGYRQTFFDEEEFLRYYTTWFLGWLARETQRHDRRHHLHVNPHAIFCTFPEYDFPGWRRFLTTLGSSSHPSWHYRAFRREQYALGLSANMDIVRTGAGPLPFWLTELQGGYNLYSGFIALCPTREQTTQWIWTALASGVSGIIFWMLNPRAAKDEPGEWALIDYQRQPSDRLLAARGAVSVIRQDPALFAQARPVKSGVTFLMARESFWTENQQRHGIPGQYEGRNEGAGMRSVLAWYEALLETGIPSDIVEMDEFDWDQDTYEGQVIFLSHQLSIPSRHWERLKRVVTKGAKLVVEGLTGYFDEHQVCVMQTGFPLSDLLGGSVREVKLIGDTFKIPMGKGRSLPAHLWRGTIANRSGKVISAERGDVYATRHVLGQGETLWIPSLVALGAWQRDNAPLARLVREEILPCIAPLPVIFKKQEKLALIKTLQSGEETITVIINNGPKSRKMALSVQGKRKPRLLYASHGGKISRASISIASEETMVIRWSAC